MGIKSISRRAFLSGAATFGSALALNRFARLASGGLALAPSRPSPASGSKPNFLIIIADDMGYSDAGCYGGEIQTPNLDGLAANGLRFTQCYSTGRCWPSRTSLLTGYYPQQVRMDPPRGLLPAWTRVVPHYLKPLGYRCYQSGKWHLMGAPRGVADGGFDHSYILHDHNRFFTPQNHELDDRKLPGVEEGTDVSRASSPRSEGGTPSALRGQACPERSRRDGRDTRTEFYVTTAIANYAVDFLKEHAERHRGEPFYCYLAFTSPHFPLHALQDDIARYRDRYLEGWDAIREQRWKRMRQMGLVNCGLPPLEPGVIPDWNFTKDKLQEMIGPGEVDRAVAWNTLSEQQKRFQATKMAIHAAMVDRMDREIGRVLDQVRKMNAFQDTVIFFVSDNGASAEQIIRGDMNDPSSSPGSAKSYLCLGPGWSSCSNTPFRLHKSWVHEGGISSPLIVHWPAGFKAQGELRHDPCHFIDIVPTVLDLAGGADFSPQWKGEVAPPLPGTSLAPAFAKDGAVTHEFIYFHHLENRAIRVGDWKLVAKGADPAPIGLGAPANSPGTAAPSSGEGPRARQPIGAGWELYDLKTDRCESKNLADKYPDKVREMSALWQKCEDQFRHQAGPQPEKKPVRRKAAAK